MKENDMKVEKQHTRKRYAAVMTEIDSSGNYILIARSGKKGTGKLLSKQQILRRDVEEKGFTRFSGAVMEAVKSAGYEIWW